MAGAPGLAVDVVGFHVVRDPAQEAAGRGAHRPRLRAGIQLFPRFARAPACGVGKQNLRGRNVRRDGERSCGPFQFREPVRRRREPLRARQRVQPGLPHEALQHVGDGRDRPARPAPGFAPPVAFRPMRALSAVQQRIEEVPGGVLRGIAQAKDAIPVMGHRSVGTVAETDAARSPRGHDDRLLRPMGKTSAQYPVVLLAQLLGQRVVDPSRLRLHLPALYRRALDLAQGVFMERAEPPVVLQAERLYDFEKHDRPYDALHVARAARASSGRRRPWWRAGRRSGVWRGRARNGAASAPAVRRSAEAPRPRPSPRRSIAIIGGAPVFRARSRRGRRHPRVDLTASLRAAVSVRLVRLTAIRTTCPDPGRGGVSFGGVSSLAVSAPMRVSPVRSP